LRRIKRHNVELLKRYFEVVPENRTGC